MTAEKAWEKKGEDKRDAVARMFSDIAPTYDRLNRLISFRLDQAWRREAVRLLELKPGDAALDVATGTGDFLPVLRRAVGPTGTVVGLDFCPPMLAVAAGKGLDNLGAGDACALPVRSDSFDGVSVGWGLRNVPDVDAALGEVCRVLRPGGRFVSLDMARSPRPLLRAGSRLVFHRLVPALGALFGKRAAYTYLPESTERFHSREELADAMTRAGFASVGWRDLFLGNLCIHYGTKP